jgi:hypothetical protein
MSLTLVQQKYELARQQYADALKEALFPDPEHLDLNVFKTYIKIKYDFDFDVDVRIDTLSEAEMYEIRKIDATMPIRIGYDRGTEIDEALAEMHEIITKFYNIDIHDSLFEHYDDYNTEDHGYYTFNISKQSAMSQNEMRL